MVPGLPGDHDTTPIAIVARCYLALLALTTIGEDESRYTRDSFLSITLIPEIYISSTLPHPKHTDISGLCDHVSKPNQLEPQ